MVKILFITTLVSVICVISHGAWAYQFEDYFKLDYQEAPDSSDSTEPTMFSFRVSSQSRRKPGEGTPGYHLSHFLETGGQVTVRLSQSIRTSTFCDRLTLIITPLDGISHELMRFTLEMMTGRRRRVGDGSQAAADSERVQPVFNPSHWINGSARPDEESPSDELIFLSPDDIFINGTMELIDTLICEYQESDSMRSSDVDNVFHDDFGSYRFFHENPDDGNYSASLYELVGLSNDGALGGFDRQNQSNLTAQEPPDGLDYGHPQLGQSEGVISGSPDLPVENEQPIPTLPSIFLAVSTFLLFASGGYEVESVAVSGAGQDQEETSDEDTSDSEEDAQEVIQEVCDRCRERLI